MPTLNIASFNIRRDSFWDGSNAWWYRRDWVKELLNRHKLDIVGVQEAKANQVDFLASGRFGYVGVGRDDGKRRGEFSPIFYDKNRFKVLHSGTFWLSPRPDVPSIGWDADNNRVCTWACLQDRTPNGERFFVFNTHLDNKGRVAREKSVTLILQQIRQIAEAAPFFLLGDFNLRPSTPEIRHLSSKLRNSRLVTKTRPTGPNGTANGFDINSPLSTRIDYIFVSATVQVLSYSVLKEIRNGRYPSDHLPVVIRAEIGRKTITTRNDAPPKAEKRGNLLPPR